jgi:DNA-binding NarL/FixJ family response regulator
MNADATPVDENGVMRPRLLIADDDTIVRSTLSAQLRRDFDVVAVAENASQAIELAGRHQPDLALIDVQMPDGGAREAVPKIAHLAPDTCMVILSGDESREVVIELLDAGAIAYMRKGLTGAKLSQTLKDALRAGELARADRETELAPGERP